MHMNQGDDLALSALRTILSTKAVQNVAIPAGTMANSLDCRISPQNPSLPCFCALQNFSLESRRFPAVQVLAHILIHTNCAERPDFHFLTTTE